jgi:S1-C subfamily serine protease
VKGPKHLWTGDWRAIATTSRSRGRRFATCRRRRPSPSRRAAGAALRCSAGIATVLLLAAALRGRAARRRQAATQPRAQRRRPATPIGSIYAKASPAVVSVRTRGATGTGFLFDRDGTLVTNAHVVGRSRQVAVRFGPTATASTRPCSASTRRRTSPC